LWKICHDPFHEFWYIYLEKMDFSEEAELQILRAANPSIG